MADAARFPGARPALAVALALPLLAAIGPDPAAGGKPSPPLERLIEQLGASPGTVLAIEPRHSEGGASYRLLLARDGVQSWRTVRVVDGEPSIDTTPAPVASRLAPALEQMLAEDPLPLARLVHRAEAVARGFVARAAEYEIEGGRPLAEVELERRGTIVELALDPFSGDVLAMEIEDDGDDDGDEDDGEDGLADGLDDLE